MENIMTSSQLAALNRLGFAEDIADYQHVVSWIGEKIKSKITSITNNHDGALALSGSLINSIEAISNKVETKQISEQHAMDVLLYAYEEYQKLFVEFTAQN